MLKDLQLASLLPNQRTGRLPPANPPEVEKVIAEFRNRKITYYRLARSLNVSSTAAAKWFKGQISQARLEQLKDLLAKVQNWEEENGRLFGT